MFSGFSGVILLNILIFIVLGVIRLNKDFYLQRMGEECEIRGFSKRTKKLYVYILSRFLSFCEEKRLSIELVTVKSYLLSLHITNNSVRIHHAALHFFFRNVLQQSFSIEQIPLKKRYNPLPKVLSKEHIKQIIATTNNVKHRLIIKLLYSTGLRLQELINLKREHLDFERNQLFVKQGKGNKDRITLLSQTIKDDLLIYYSTTHFTTPYLFEGRKGKYSKKSVQKILETKGKIIGVHLTPHMLRHSFATHLLEAGTNIRYIQQLLGHAKLQTTQGYTHVAQTNIQNIKNPLDEL